jgi:hypothetical protein
MINTGRETRSAEDATDLIALIQDQVLAARQHGLDSVALTLSEGAAVVACVAALQQARDAADTYRAEAWGHAATWMERAEAAECQIQAAEQELTRLRRTEVEVWQNPEQWMKWCDIRVLERAEAAEDRIARVQALVDRWRGSLSYDECVQALCAAMGQA